MREIKIPEEIVKLTKPELEVSVSNNDDVLLSFCSKRPPKHGVVTNYGIVWKSYPEFQKDAEETCHYFYQLYVFTYRESVYAPSHADEIYNQKINPYTLQPLS